MIKHTHGQNKTKQGKRAKWENKKIWPERYKKKTREELDRREKKKKKRDEKSIGVRGAFQVFQLFILFLKFIHK